MSNLLRLSSSAWLLGMLLLAAPVSAGEADSALSIQIAMSNYSFVPSTLQLRANTTYRLRLTNTSHSGHDLDAPQLFAASSIAPADQSKVTDGEIEVDGGQTVEVTFTPIRAGTYDFHCTHFLHSAFGMHGEAIVR